MQTVPHIHVYMHVYMHAHTKYNLKANNVGLDFHLILCSVNSRSVYLKIGNTLSRLNTKDEGFQYLTGDFTKSSSRLPQTVS